MNNDHMQQAEKELSEEREMKLDFICKKCGSTEYEIKDKSNGTGIAHGLYCAKCGFWHKWIGKEELKRRLIERGDNIQDIEVRLGRLEYEEDKIKLYDYVIKNDDFEKTVQVIMTIIENEKRIEDERV